MTKILSPTAQINLLKLNCIDLRKAAFRNGYDITLSTHKLNAYG